MDLQIALQHRGQVEAFQRKHRIGLLTLLFTDIVGSTQLKQTLGDSGGYALLREHHAVVREILAGFPEGEEISTAGDCFFIVFAKPSEAVKFSLLLQARLRTLAKTSAAPVLDRIGIHVGEVIIEERPGEGKGRDLYGIQVDICARVMSLGKGDQVLLTRSAFDSARQVLKQGDMLNRLLWMNHGQYVLKGIDEPIEICAVGEEGLASASPLPDSEKVHRHISAESEPVLGWRPAIGQAVPNTRWLLEEKLGEGGSGEVWWGRHETLAERRVFKFCFRADRARYLKREVAVFRLVKERVGQHPNIVGVQDVYFDSPPYYIMMDYSEGRDLRSWAEAKGGLGQIPLATRLEIVAQVADGLQAAHEAGVIHRDVKPANILVADAPTSGPSAHGPAPVHARLTDFGIGQVVEPERLKEWTKAGLAETAGTGTVAAGTTLYLAPELLAGKPASIRSDIYALGVVLYQLLTGDFSRPVTIDWAREVKDPLLRADLASCLSGDSQEQFAGAAQLAKNLRSIEARRHAVVEAEAASRALERAAFRRGLLRASLIFGPLVVLFLWWLWLNAPPAKMSQSDSGFEGPNAMTFYLAAGTVVETNSLEAVTTNDFAVSSDLLREALKRNSNALTVLRMGFGYPCHGPPVTLNTNQIELTLLRLSNLLIIEGRLDEEQRRYGEAASHYLDLVRLGTDLAAGGPLVSDMVGMSITTRGTARLVEILPHLSASEVQGLGLRLDEIQRHYPTFAGVLELERRQVALELERLVQRWNWRAEAVLDSRHPERMLPAEFSGSAQISWWERAAAFGQSFPYSKRGVMKDIMTFHDQWMALARQPYHVDFVEPRFIPNPVTAGLLFTGIKHTWLRHLFVESQLGLLQVSLALHGFQLEKSSLPSSLAELAPGYLTVVPPDPFAPGATLRYRSTGSDYVVYSVGPDGKDDGGTFPANERYNLQGTNYIGDIGILRLHPSRK